MGRTGADWSTVFRRSTVHPAVFAVRDVMAAADLGAWAREHGLAHRHQAYAFSAELDGWALLDGGLSYLQSRAHGRLRSGLRVIGWWALRHVAAELELTPPRRLLVGEPERRPPDELERLAAEGWVVAPPPARQATLLVSYVDARGLNEVACTLVGALSSARHVAPAVPVRTPLLGARALGSRVPGERMPGERMPGAAGGRVVGGRVVGDRVVGDRVVGDRVIGDRVIGDRLVGERVVRDPLTGNRVVGGRVLGPAVGRTLRQTPRTS